MLLRVRQWLPEREIFVRAGGAVRFVRITTRMQVMAASLVAMLVGAWMLATGAMLWRQQSVSAAAAVVDAQRSVVSSEAARASADRRSVNAIAHDLEKGQDAIDAIVEDHFGDTEGATSVPAQPVVKPQAANAPLTGTQRLAELRHRQQRFVAKLRVAATQRLARVEAAIREVGLNPAQLAPGGRGGPFIPASALTLTGDRELRALAGLLDRLSAMESALTVLPSGRPTMAPMQTSSYGYRRDPFNGLPAFHAGIDFPGTYGQPILAASNGRVAFVGQRSGYGNCVEIDHGHGILTRYAHLSGFVARPGQSVTRGQQIARMGSTGRSTGTHLHFEVRINGNAVNPRRFLEAKSDVLEVRQDEHERG